MGSKHTKIVAVLLVLVAFNVLNISYGLYQASYKTGESYEESGHKQPLRETQGGSTTILVPAVDAEGKGALGKFEVQAVPGSGKTLTNIEHIFFLVDTQFSMQTAKAVAANVTGVDISKYNLVYDIDLGTNESRAVEGPSAGAALAIATIAAIENRTLDPSVMITGTINPDGTIGRVGQIAEKSKMAKEAGAAVLLVPQGQGLKQEVKVEIDCKQVGGARVCSTEYRPRGTVSMDQSGLIVREVSNVEEALKYFLQ